MYYFLKIVFYIACIGALLTLPATMYAAVIYEDAQLMSIFMGAGTLLMLIAMYLESQIRNYHEVSLNAEFYELCRILREYNDRAMR